MVTITSKDDNLAKGPTRYLESRLCEIAATAQRCTLENGTAPARPRNVVSKWPSTASAIVTGRSCNGARRGRRRSVRRSGRGRNARSGSPEVLQTAKHTNKQPLMNPLASWFVYLYVWPRLSGSTCAGAGRAGVRVRMSL